MLTSVISENEMSFALFEGGLISRTAVLMGYIKWF